MKSDPKFDPIFNAMGAASVGDLSIRVPIPKNPDLEDLATKFSIAINVLFEDLELRSEQAESNFFELLFHNHPIPMWIYDIDTLAFLEINAAAIEKYGFTRDEFLGLTIKDIRPVEDIPMLMADIKQGRPVQQQSAGWRHCLKDGSIIDVEISSHTLKYKGRKSALVVVHDVTARIENERKVKESEARIRSIIDSALDAVIAIDSNSVITTWNPQAEQCFGWSEKEALGKYLYDLIIPSQQRELHRSGLKKYLETGNGPVLNRRIELTALHHDGHEFPVEVSITPIHTNHVVIFSGFIRDISDRKQAQLQIERKVNHLNALRKIDLTILSSFDLDFNLPILLNILASLLSVDATNIMLVNPSTHKLESKVGVGFRTSNFSGRKLNLGEGNAGQAALDRKLVRVDDLTLQNDNPRLARALTGEDFISYVGIPLIAKGQLKGVLEVFHRSPLRVEEEWLAELNSVAAQMAIAIDNATLFEHLERSNIELIVAYDATIEGWSRALDLRDKETEGHSVRVAELTIEIADRFGFSERELLSARRGALLHDIGKLGVPDAILLKQSKLTEDEWVIMKKHPIFAREMLYPILYLRESLDIPYCHHEKWDGTGYPRGLEAEQIPIAARIFAVVDVYDALRSDRPYRKAWSQGQAVEYIREQSGKHFDPQMVDLFLKGTSN